MTDFEPRQELLHQRFGRRPLSFEIIPPTVEQPEDEAQRRSEGLNRLAETVQPDAINIPEVQPEEQKGDRGNRRSDFEPRVEPREYVRQLKQDHPDLDQVSPMINRVVVKHKPDYQRRWLEETYRDYDIPNLVLVGGESSEKDYPGPSVPEGNRLVRKVFEAEDKQSDYLVGNITIPSRRGKDPDEPERMLYKINAGADYFTSQILMQADHAVDLVQDLGELLARENVAPPMIFWSFTPVREPKDVDFLRWLGVLIPDEVEERILSSDDPLAASIQQAREVLTRLRQANQSLNRPFPMGLNVSFMGLRNLVPAQRMANRLRD